MFTRSDLVLYKDRAFKNPFVIEELEDCEPGKTVGCKGYLSNNTNYEIFEISYESKDSDLTIHGVPKKLSAGSWLPVDIKFTPSEDRIIPLQTTITITGKIRETVGGY